MLDQEPLWYPSRNSFPYDPGIPNKQLWAIGMIVVQWSALEWLIDTETHRLVGDNQALKEEYKQLRNFQQSLAFWQTQTDLKAREPARSQVLALIPRIQNLSSQRDEVVHRLWGGGMEATSWSADGNETTDAVIMHDPGEPIKGSPGLMPPKWRASFIRLRQMAREIGALNRDLIVAMLQLPPRPDGPTDPLPPPA
jgi:hypothetical protein